jgi:hypothetical protein
MNPIEVRRDGEVICVCKDESCLYPSDIMKDMMKYGYKNTKDILVKDYDKIVKEIEKDVK